MTERYTLYRAIRADHADLADVMFDAVRHGPSLYTEDQRAQWVPHPRNGADWDDRLDRQTVILARDAAGVAGFMSLAPDGYIDFAYIRPRSQGTGLFRQLFSEIEALSVARRDGRMWTHASLMAQPAFTAMGFAIVEHQTIEIGGQTFDRAEMEKRRRGTPDLAAVVLS